MGREQEILTVKLKSILVSVGQHRISRQPSVWGINMCCVINELQSAACLMHNYVTHKHKKLGCEIKINLRVCLVWCWTLSALADDAYERLPCVSGGGLTSLDQFPSGLLASGFKGLDVWITNIPLFYLLVSFQKWKIYLVHFSSSDITNYLEVVFKRLK